MAQNIYDDPDFFVNYSGLPRSLKGLQGAPEWPALRAMVPPLAGRSVVDLGCGFGWFCRWAATAGAAEVLGIDLSTKMLARARADTSSAIVTYEQADLETVDLPMSRFDLAYSSLTLHYLSDIDRLFRVVHQSLRPDGSLVFSIEHPIYSAPAHPEFVGGPNESMVWPLDGYLSEGPRAKSWLGADVVKQHRTIASYMRALLDNGFALTALEEWGPSEAQIEQTPEWAIELERPYFLLVVAYRR